MKLNIEIPYTEFKWLQEENLIISLPSLIYACKWVSERYKTPENQMTVRKLKCSGFLAKDPLRFLKMFLRLCHQATR